MEVRLEVIAADVVMDSTHPVLQVEDVPMQRFEVRALGTVFNVVPFARQGAQVTFPSVRGHNGRSLNGRFKNLLERFSRSIFNHGCTAPLQFRLPYESSLFKRWMEFFILTKIRYYFEVY